MHVSVAGKVAFRLWKTSYKSHLDETRTADADTRTMLEFNVPDEWRFGSGRPMVQYLTKAKEHFETAFALIDASGDIGGKYGDDVEEQYCRVLVARGEVVDALKRLRTHCSQNHSSMRTRTLLFAILGEVCASSSQPGSMDMNPFDLRREWINVGEQCLEQDGTNLIVARSLLDFFLQQHNPDESHLDGAFSVLLQVIDHHTPLKHLDHALSTSEMKQWIDNSTWIWTKFLRVLQLHIGLTEKCDEGNISKHRVELESRMEWWMHLFFSHSLLGALQLLPAQDPDLDLEYLKLLIYECKTHYMLCQILGLESKNSDIVAKWAWTPVPSVLMDNVESRERILRMLTSPVVSELCVQLHLPLKSYMR